jgi:hypothetical protein
MPRTLLRVASRSQVEDILDMRAADGGGTAKKSVAKKSARKSVARLMGRVRIELQRNRRPIAVRGPRRPSRRTTPPTEAEVLISMARAWLTATSAVVLFCGALALAPIWDRAIFSEALREALTTNPELPQPADEGPVDAPTVPGLQGERR